LLLDLGVVYNLAWWKGEDHGHWVPARSIQDLRSLKKAKAELDLPLREQKVCRWQAITLLP
jgi:hypothetical protein